MEEIGDLLFRKPFEGRPLFKNQLDLVRQIIDTNTYPYRQDDLSEYSKFQIRLKTYVSQLLSDNAVRNITDEFKQAMETLISRKINDENLREHILLNIFEKLRSKNVHINKADSNEVLFEKDLRQGNYFSVISAKPIEINRLKDREDFSLSASLFQNYVLNHLESDGIKYYRLNFPLESYCELFWLGFQKMIFHELLELIENGYLDSLVKKEKYLINGLYEIVYEGYKAFRPKTNHISEELKTSFCLGISNLIVEFLNRHKIVLTFHITDPIFSATTIAISPDNLAKGKVYFLVEDELRKNQLIKPNQEGLLLWRIFVWDKIKTSKTSRNIERPVTNNTNIINKIVE